MGSSLLGAASEVKDDLSVAVFNPPPVHPIYFFRDPFKESISDAKQRRHVSCRLLADPQNAEFHDRYKHILSPLDSTIQYNFSYNKVWRVKTQKGQLSTFHPLVKVVAQVSFALYLLHEGLEESVTDVVKISGGLLDELDAFVRRASRDIIEFAKEMKVTKESLNRPLTHPEEFKDRMRDQGFRQRRKEDLMDIMTQVRRMREILEDYDVDFTALKEADTEMDEYYDHVMQEDAWASRDMQIVRMLYNLKRFRDRWKRKNTDIRHNITTLRKRLHDVNNYCAELDNHLETAKRKYQSGMDSPRSYSSRSGSPMTVRPVFTPSLREEMTGSPLRREVVPSGLGTPISIATPGSLRSPWPEATNHVPSAVRRTPVLSKPLAMDAQTEAPGIAIRADSPKVQIKVPERIPEKIEHYKPKEPEKKRRFWKRKRPNENPLDSRSVSRSESHMDSRMTSRAESRADSQIESLAELPGCMPVQSHTSANTARLQTPVSKMTSSSYLQSNAGSMSDLGELHPGRLGTPTTAPTTPSTRRPSLRRQESGQSQRTASPKNSVVESTLSYPSVISSAVSTPRLFPKQTHNQSTMSPSPDVAHFDRQRTSVCVFPTVVENRPLNPRSERMMVYTADDGLLHYPLDNSRQPIYKPPKVKKSTLSLRSLFRKS